jgi:phenylalanine ammonia-lyase
MFQTHAHVTSMQTAAQPQAVQIDGHNLSIGDVVAVARNGAQAKIAESVHPAVEASVAFKESKNHTSVYGVTTGFGGSADTRTSDTEALQISLLEHQLCGFLPVNASYENM